MKTGYKVKTAWVNSPEADAIAEYYKQGHTTKETLERFGINKGQLANLRKARGITNGRTFRSGGDAENSKRSSSAEQRLAEHLSENGFEYVGGYSGKHGSAKIRCQKCGTEFVRSVYFLRRGNVRCVECQKAETQKRNEAKRQIAAQEAETRKIEREWYRLAHPPKKAYEEQHEAFLNRSGICEICGKPYTVREYVESCGMKYARNCGVCSEKCHKIKLNRSTRKARKERGVRDNHRHRAKKHGVAYDSSITLKKLVERDGLKCAICGEVCDWNDHSWSKYSGPMYPSIDHIVPMAKGGPHTWENVQVAHIICNSEKGASVQLDVV